MTTTPKAPPPSPPPLKRRRFARYAILIIVLLLAIAAGALAATWAPLQRAAGAYRRGRVAESISTAEAWSRVPLWSAQYHQLLAAAYLTGGRQQSAKPHLDALSGTRLFVSVVPKADVAHQIFARGRYADYLAYDAAVHERSEPAGTPLYRAAALAALNRISEADIALKSIDRSAVDARKLAAVEAAVTQRKSGAYPLVLDRSGRTIAALQIASNDLVAIDTQFAPLIEKEAGSLTFEAQLPRLGTNDTIVTTLDPDVQRAALTALGGFRGSLVAIDPATNQILAIASTRGNGPMANLALEHQYEPGSVVKTLTGLNAIVSGFDINAFFPYHCTGDLVIDGRHFPDWLPQGHGNLPSIDDAYAESCNIVFGDIGVRLGADKLRAFMVRAGFDDQTDLGVFTVPLGKIVPPILNRYETAFLAIGLKHETMTALHIAMLASMMANRGALTTPRLLLERRTILGEATPPAKVQGSQQLVPQSAADRMIQAMQRVVTSPNGTGKRAAVEGLTIAMKTGTAGSHAEGGLEAIILAFAPVDHPRIAFGMIAEDAGPAEFAGAKIAHDFLEAIKPRLVDAR